MKSSPEHGEMIIDYVERKYENNPLFVLFAVSSWIKEIELSHWISELPEINLKFILMNLKLEDQSFFEFGVGVSNNQANKIVAKRLIEKSSLLEWLKEKKIYSPNL